MLRKAYVPGAAALLAALLLGGCTGGSSSDGRADNANPGGSDATTAAAQPGRYRTLPEACRAVGHNTLDSLLPGIKQIMDVDQRDKAYEGQATLTYDTDRKVGCRWKVESSDATDHLSIDFERVVSYDNTVSDDSQAQSVFAAKRAAAHLPEPTATENSASTTESRTASGAGSASPSGSGSTPPSSPSPSASSASSPSPDSSSSASGDAASADLQPRLLSDLGDEALLDDALGGSGSTAQQRTVTVAFRTSNVIVTIVYEEQPATVGVVPDSKEMQDKARKLAARLADSLGG
ncbi:DUF3558 domain-containing protein [Streptomyces sp. 6-11-2]|uniref:DUF3558 domain-containing protein n=1 Tax=Streptomyces sp. 6-11-2 TaxID=2585753 RepID=UPI001170D4B5|nr:DUF3558 domain-containing protein [Streptomyces sp. 6-11-2]GED85538.1 hypothetical protein TNCT6_26230 [Streptomyces sp. 6-11-2]